MSFNKIFSWLILIIVLFILISGFLNIKISRGFADFLTGITYTSFYLGIIILFLYVIYMIKKRVKSKK